jgi:hypothetical protein
MSMSQDREQMLPATFVELADTLVADFDVADFLHGLANRCVRLLDVDAAGLMLADQRGSLRVIASSSEQAHLMELFQLQHEEGPCLEGFSRDCRCPSWTWRRRDSGGRHSPRPLPARGSRPCRRCPCGCVKT